MSAQLSHEESLFLETERRAETDYRFRWGTYFGWNLLTLGFVLSLGGIYSHIATHRLIRRRNEHITRRLAWCSYLWHALAARANSQGRGADVQEALDNLSVVYSKIVTYVRSHERNARQWTLLRFAFRTTLAISSAIVFARVNNGETYATDSVVKIGSAVNLAALLGATAVGSYINGFLNADFRFLETWEKSFGENAEWIIGRLGIAGGSPPRAIDGKEPVPERNTAVYVLLSIITFGLFSVFWRYLVMTDGNAHFEADARMEDSILRALGVKAPAVPRWGPEPPPGTPGVPGEGESPEDAPPPMSPGEMRAYGPQGGGGMTNLDPPAR